MIFLRQTFFNTTTVASVTSGTATVVNMIDKKASSQFETVGDDSDLTSSTIVLNLSSTETVSNICLLNHNLQDYHIFYMVGANTTTFSPDIVFSTNSETSQYFSFNTVTTDNIHLKGNETITADEEKKVGEFIVSNLFYDFETDRLPTAKNYRPEIRKKQVVHKMSDGGINLYNIADKFRARIKLDFVPTSTEIILKSVFDSADPVNFIPFETTSSWNADIYEVNWTGHYNIMQFSDNNRGNGFKGQIMLQESTGRI